MKRLSLRNICRISVGFLILIILGCAAPPKKPPESIIPTEPKMPAPLIGKDPFSIIPEQYRNKAIEYEKNGDLYKALQSWQIVANFIPNDEDLVKKITELKSQTQVEADEHFAKGLFYYQKNSVQEAQREFLLTLSYNPDHKEALNYLKNKLTGENHKLYEVKKGDTLKEVARRTYQDPQKDFLIAYFNNLGKDAKLVPGATLKIPILELTLAKQPVKAEEMPMDEKEIPVSAKERSLDVKEMVSKALVSFKAKEYREAAFMAEKTLEIEPASKDARDLINASYYQMGKKLSQEKKYQEALTMFTHVESGFNDVRKWIASTKKQLAEAHYIEGVKYFTREEFDKAIKEWEATLTMDPNHQRAKKDIENARSLLQKLKEIK
jgi:tetratricopeptide (TPR) repeat protein